MKNVFLILVFLIISDYLLPSCANPQAPTGGPKDTIPPTLLEANPQIGTINFKGQEITLVFNEAVKADRLQAILIVTPQQDVKFKTIARKNKLTLKFDEPFPDSTTITLSFLEGVTDVTENNPAKNLSYVFSTGSYLDSLSISGQVNHLMTSKPADEITVGLFVFHDSLNLQATKPTYITKTDEYGQFKISNIKNGQYRLMAFHDINNNLILDGNSEAFGFISDTITLSENIVGLQIPLIKQNITELRLISSRTITKYYELKFSKGPALVTTQPSFDYSFDYKTNAIRLYKPESMAYGDSILTVLNVMDSLSNELQDSVYVKFNESDRKQTAFEATILPKEKKLLSKTTYSLTFTKPVVKFDSSLLLFRKDSTIHLPIATETKFEWNNNYTQLTLTHTFDTIHYYSIQKQQFDSLLASRVDTIPMTSDSTLRGDSLLIKPNASIRFKKHRPVILSFLKGAFISVERDTLASLEKNLSFYTKKELGGIIVNIVGFNPTDQVELINKSFTVIRTYPFATQIQMQNIPPGEYGIRVLIDSNQDGLWTQGNFLKNIETEKVYVYPEFTSLRANWEINLNISK